MLKPVQIVAVSVALLAIIGYATSASNKTTNTTSTTTVATPTTTGSASGSAGSLSDGKTINTTDVDYVGVMQKCNESFPISIDYLEELNNTGSFPDETDKGPMCYIKCFLVSIGVLREDFTIDKDALALMSIWPNSIEAIDGCLKDQDGLFDNDPNEDCGKAYYLARCVMMKEVLSSRNADTS